MDLLGDVATLRARVRATGTGTGTGGTGTGSGGIVTRIDQNIKVVESLNYAMLHNNGSVFEDFTISNPHPVVGKVRVLVDLFQGESSAPYKCVHAFRTANERIELHRTDVPFPIRLPLASRLMRSLKEPLRTTMLVQIQNLRDTPDSLFEGTFPITLLPVRQWRDTPRDAQWLPSFIQPNDPAVLSVIRQAQKYLMALQDDPSVGFDGYMSLDPDDGEDFQALDAQVRALWCALQYDHDLKYINPPPAYRRDSQRLRMPSEVIDGKRGTCIDLAILVASCLENIEIHPVVFLLKGHCFPAYWRSAAFRSQFLEDAVKSARIGKATEKWYFEPEIYPQIREAVAEGKLVPLETVRLTDRPGFVAALDEGLENLRSSAGFEAMIDIPLAREQGVTPLPLTGDD